jgi:hypothetical protein
MSRWKRILSGLAALVLAAMIGAIWRRFLHRAASEGKPNPQS